MSCVDQHLGMHSYLEVDGQEIANGARTIEYIRNGLAGTSWRATDGCSCSVLWRQLSCDSAEACFIDPATDAAPWYDAAIPASADYLGILIPDLGQWFDGQASRAVSARISGLGGASISPMHQTPRDLIVEGILVGASAAGIEYGRRWLQNVLSKLSDPCNLSEARIYASCPPCDGSDDEEGEWFVYRVGLTSGVTKTSKPAPGPGCPDRMDVTFTMLAGNPYLYKAPVVVAPAATVNPEGCESGGCLDFCYWLQTQPPALEAAITPPTSGVLGVVITVSAPNGLSNLTIETLDACGGGGTVTGSMVVSLMGDNSTLVIDSALRTITYTGADGIAIDGTGLIALPLGLGVPWLEIGPTNPAGCISAQLSAICDSDCLATVEIATRARMA